MDFLQISEPVASDFEKMNQTIIRELRSEVPLIEEIAKYLIDSGGKRLRPLITLLSSRACGYEGEEHVSVATVIEFYHTSTLLHDDVVDQSDLRRGQPTANSVWGNATSVLVGDFLLSKAFQLAVNTRNFRLLDVLAEMTRTIAEGEVMQLSNCRRTDTTEAEYLKVIQYKTADLFQRAAQSGCIIGHNSESLESASLEKAVSTYGFHLGCAFQLIDDILDYTGSPAEMGKSIGDDLAEGKATLPLIYTLKNGSEADKKLVEEAIRIGTIDHIEPITAAIKQCGALNYTFELAKLETDKAVQALDQLDDSVYKKALIQLAQASLDRCH